MIFYATANQLYNLRKANLSVTQMILIPFADHRSTPVLVFLN